MLKSKTKMIVATAGILMLTACGGDPTTKANDSTKKDLKLTVGNTTIDSHSSLGRATYVISDSSSKVTTISINKPGSITISGTDANLFNLDGNATTKTLSFKEKPNAFDPRDENVDGVYNLDINGSDTKGNSIIYQAAYKINIPPKAKSVLKGKTYYIDYKQNKYSKITFNDSTLDEVQYQDTEETKTSTVAVEYQDNKFSFNQNGDDITCEVLDKGNPPKLDCKKDSDGSKVDLVLLLKAPEFVAPESYKVHAVTADIYNNDDSFTPHITDFYVTGTQPKEDGKAIISKSKISGKYSFSFAVDEPIYLKKMAAFLGDEDWGVSATIDDPVTKKYTVGCQVKNLSNDINGTEVEYECLSVDTTTQKGGVNDTEMKLFVCNDTNLSNAETKCSSASVPVGFTD